MKQHGVGQGIDGGDGHGKSGILGPIIVGIVVALVAGGSAPWWWTKVSQITRVLNPPRSHLVVGSFSYTTSGISLWVENTGTKSGAIDKVRMVLYCNGLYFKRSDLPPELHDAPDWQRHVWGRDYDLPLDASKENSKTIPPQSSKTFAYAISRTALPEIENSFPKNAPVGSFWDALNNESIILLLDVQVSDWSGKVEHKVSKEPFDRLVYSLLLNR